MKKTAKKGGKAAAKRPGRTRVTRDVPMRAEYDFSGAVRNKYGKRFAAGSNVVVLEPDVAQAFPTAKAVNAALRRALAGEPTKRGGGTKRRSA